MRDRKQITIVYPFAGSDFHKQLARRLASACEEKSRTAKLLSSAEVRDMDDDRLAGETTLIVNPWECTYKIGPPEKFFSRLSAARKRITVLAEAVEIEWFKKQFRLPMQHDMMIDIGFASQESKLHDFDIPYRFLFNSPTRRDERTIMRADPSRRTIPWAYVGHYRETRMKLAAELVEKFDPSGFVFLTKGGAVMEGRGTIGPLGLSSVLSKTKYYVWNSHHEFEYYESLRFMEAIMAGAIPCKIDSRVNWKKLDAPGIFSSVQELADSARNEGFTSMWRSARDFYLSRGRLADHLEEVLKDV